MTRSVRYQPILHTLYYTLHTEHAYCLSYRFLNNVVITPVIEMVEILDGRVGQRSVERVRYVINNLLHLVIVKYLVILHADPCNKSYIYIFFFHFKAGSRQNLENFLTRYMCIYSFARFLQGQILEFLVK